jgi:outer membrane protein
LAVRTIQIAVALIILATSGVANAQDTALLSTEYLTLEQAIELAMRKNHSVKIALLAVERADEHIAASKTFRLPSLHACTLVSGNLAKNEIKLQNPAANFFPGLDSFFALNVERKPTAIFSAAAIEPLSQQYRIGLNIKLDTISRDLAQVELRLRQDETFDQVKKAYYAILQTESAQKRPGSPKGL